MRRTRNVTTRQTNNSSRIKRKKLRQTTKLPTQTKTLLKDTQFRGKLLSSIGIICILLGIAVWLFPISLRSIARLSQPTTSQTANKLPVSIASASASRPDSPIRIDTMLMQKKSTVRPPIRIVIPNLQIDLPITESEVIDGYWELSETTVSHGAGSAFPGENGNIVLFAHARERLFLPLRRIQKDDLIYVLTTDSWHRYRVSVIQEVSPNDITVVAPTKTETLTLFTCTGFLDNKRLIVSSIPYQP